MQASLELGRISRFGQVQCSPSRVRHGDLQASGLKPCSCRAQPAFSHSIAIVTLCALWRGASRRYADTLTSKRRHTQTHLAAGPTLSVLSCFSDLDDVPEAPGIDDSKIVDFPPSKVSQPKLDTTQLGHWRVNSALLDVLDIAHKEAMALGHLCISEEATVLGLFSSSIASDLCSGEATAPMARCMAELALRQAHPKDVMDELYRSHPCKLSPKHHLPLGQCLQEAMAEAMQWHQILCHSPSVALTPMHLALALLSEHGVNGYRKNSGVMVQILQSLQVRIVDVRLAVLNDLPSENVAAIAEVQRLTSRGSRVFSLQEPVCAPRVMDVMGRAPFGQSAWPKLLAGALRSLTTGLTERRTEAKLLLLAAIAGEHVLLIGPPGTGKSLLARRLASLCQGRSFEHLMTPFTTPEEVLGPISLLALQQEDKVVRKVAGYLPHADVAFLDEIFKASSGVLSSLVSVLNERVFDNGSDRCKIPLWCLVGASNELPDAATAMDALYDRFLLRKNVSCVSDNGLHDFLTKELTRSQSFETSGCTKSTGTSDQHHHTLFDCADCKAACEAAKQVPVPSRLLRMVASLRAYLEDTKPLMVISDRRLAKAMRLLQVAAFTCGACEVSELDLLLLTHVFLDARWQDESVSTWLLAKCQPIEDEDVLRTVQRGLRQVQAKSPARGRLKRSLLQRLDTMQRVVEEKAEIWHRAEASIQHRMAIAGLGPKKSAEVGFSWLDPSAVQMMAGKLLPQVRRVIRFSESLLSQVMLQIGVLKADSSPVALSDRPALLLPSSTLGPQLDEESLLEVPGIGPVLAQQLVDRFGSMKAVLEVAVAEGDKLMSMPGIGPRRLQQIRAHEKARMSRRRAAAFSTLQAEEKDRFGGLA